MFSRTHFTLSQSPPGEVLHAMFQSSVTLRGLPLARSWFSACRTLTGDEKEGVHVARTGDVGPCSSRSVNGRSHAL